MIFSIDFILKYRLLIFLSSINSDSDIFIYAAKYEHITIRWFVEMLLLALAMARSFSRNKFVSILDDIPPECILVIGFVSSDVISFGFALVILSNISKSPLTLNLESNPSSFKISAR